MDNDDIKEIGIDGQERLYVVPAAEALPYIYREAMEVHWDPEKNCLYSPKPREWTYGRWFEQIIKAAREQGYNLVLTDKTIWTNITDELKAHLLK